MTTPTMDESDLGPFDALARMSDRPPSLPGYRAEGPPGDDGEGPRATVEELGAIALYVDVEAWAGRLA